VDKGLGVLDEGISIVSASFSSALNAAADAASGQHYPRGALYIVATPIGNLADITLRALHVLQIADVIACEDTRHTQQMLRAYGIECPGSRMLALHQHNEATAADTVISFLREGKRVAYASDAGTPGVSDPGARLVAAVAGQRLRCVPLPGASSVTTLVSAAGLTAEGNAAGGFVFHGFLPSKSTERQQAIEGLRSERRAIVLLEAPHRIAATAMGLGALGARLVTVGRELTKQFESIESMPAGQLSEWFAADSNRLKGEFALVVHADTSPGETRDGHRVLELLLAELPVKTAVKLAAEISGQPRNALYERALALKDAQ